ncbi:hypothetical protein Tco_0027108 [Tanacetum coccineum]
MRIWFRLLERDQLCTSCIWALYNKTSVCGYSLSRCAWKKALNLLKKGLLVRGETMEDSKRLRSKLDYRIQQYFKCSSEGSGIIPDVHDEPKDNSSCLSSLLSGSNDEVQDIYIDEKKANENKADADDAEKQAGDEQPV